MIEFSPEKLLELTREHVPIQVERIAYSLGYTIRYVPLDSVDALIIVGRKGRILVKNSMSVTRKRFSISHEIGHLMRGHPLTGVMCSRIGAGLFSLAKMDNEREADEYAARLLMPSDEIDSDLKLDFSLHQAQVLSTDKYAVSLESYLVRIAKRATYPICIAHTMGTTIKWHIESSAWPEELDINGMIYDTRNKWHISELTSDDLNYDDYLIVKKLSLIQPVNQRVWYTQATSISRPPAPGVIGKNSGQIGVSRWTCSHKTMRKCARCFARGNRGWLRFRSRL